MKHTMKKALMAVSLMFSGMTMVACGTNATSSAATSSVAKTAIAAPTDFKFDPATGAYSFNATDANAGYYFIRCFSVTNGVDATTYTVSSSRIQGGSTGAKSGTIDISGFGWGTYDIKLVTFAPAGSNYVAPDPVTLKAQYGVGGVLEKPEMRVLTEGNQAEVIIDWYTLNDYYMYQVFGDMEIDFYKDEALTQLAKSDKVDLNKLVDTIDVHPAGGYIWGYSNDAMHKDLDGEKGYKNDIYTYTLDAGDYWVTCKAISASEDVFASSKASDAVKITLTADAATGATYVGANTALWEAPSVLGVPVAMKNHDNSSRIDYAGSQTTTSKIAA